MTTRPTMNRAVPVIAALLAALSAPVVARQPQAPAAQAQQPPAQTPAPGAPGQPAIEKPATPAGGYTYDGAGRRDPFVSLLGRGADPKSMANRPTGLAGVLIDEVTVKGILRGRSGFTAMLQAPDNKTYTARPGDRLMDGTVKTISADAVVFSQDVNDPLSIVKQREKRKTVRGGGESGE
jgi:Tfp pilus assembly protein PilP